MIPQNDVLQQLLELQLFSTDLHLVGFSEMGNIPFALVLSRGHLSLLLRFYDKADSWLAWIKLDEAELQ
jgi:hypothetical protein